MFTLLTRNVHDALMSFSKLFERAAVERDSRNGKVRVLPMPLTTVYEQPRERVIFWDSRDANPFFHFFEALWMLAGRDDVAFPARFSKSIAQFSDDGATFNGAYGHRWRRHFCKDEDGLYPVDQLLLITEALRANRDDRRAVLGMWDASHDLGLASKDVPCNTHAYFQVSADGFLDLMVCNRSNDAIWGAYGANAVHFSMLLEFMAAAIGVPPGRYYQTSMNTHVYERHFDLVKRFAFMSEKVKDNGNPYRGTGDSPPAVRPFPMVSTPIESWLSELNAFLADPSEARLDPFFNEVARPLLAAHDLYTRKDGREKSARVDAALAALSNCAASDWKLAATEWLERRRE